MRKKITKRLNTNFAKYLLVIYLLRNLLNKIYIYIVSHLPEERCSKNLKGRKQYRKIAGRLFRVATRNSLKQPLCFAFLAVSGHALATAKGSLENRCSSYRYLIQSLRFTFSAAFPCATHVLYSRCLVTCTRLCLQAFTVSVFLIALIPHSFSSFYPCRG